ncbi:MAG: acetyl-CoA carboxylase biotin carboxyl carrier protein [bacterium]
MDLRKVKKLIELVEESAISELEVSSGDESVRIVMHRTPAVGGQLSAPAMITAQPQMNTSASKPPGLESFVAPMAGTFYRQSHPEAPVFVEEGQQVQAGDVLCIIESMKMMHEIRAVRDARIEQVCVANGEPISTGDVLFRLL